MTYRSTLRVPSALTAAMIAASCAAGPSDPGAPPGSVSGMVAYTGAEPGVLRVAVFATFPPFGPPVAETAIDEPSFPQPYQVAGLPPGRYFVLAMIDTSPEDGDRYHPDVDPGGAFGQPKHFDPHPRGRRATRDIDDMQ